MLHSLFCLATITLPPPDGLPAFTSPEQVVKALRPLGYEFIPAVPGQGLGKLTHAGTTIGAGLALTAGDRANGVPDTYQFISLYLEMAVPNVVPTGYPWIPTKLRAGTVPPEFVSHLGGTVTESAQIDLAKGVTRTEIRKALDEFWAKGKAFAKAHGGAFVPAPAFDPKTTKLGDELTIDRADEVSIQRAILAWGWNLPTTPGYTSQGWLLPVETGGRTMWLRQRVEGMNALPRVVDVMRFDPKPTTENLWAARKSEKDPMPTVVYKDDGTHLLTPTGSIDLAKGVTLGELRRRIVAFAATGNDSPLLCRTAEPNALPGRYPSLTYLRRLDPPK